MKRWILKALVQKTISFLPFRHKLNYFFQKFVTKGVFLSDEYFYDRMLHAQAHLEAFKKYSGKAIPRTSLELGMGWYPVVPISFFLVGTEQMYSADISFLTSKERVKTTIEKFIQIEEKGVLKIHLPIKKERYARLTQILEDYETLSLEDILQQLKLTYLIEDARKISLPDSSIDIVHSNNTFEHIYPEILVPILKDFRRVVRKGDGVMSHAIDMSDHFAHFDKSINIYNFLQFSDSKWKWIDNSIQPQNRLRFDDYVNIYKDLNIPITEESHRPGRLDELKDIELDKKYRSHPLERLAISHCHLISEMH
jgi:hypothetical protein